MESEVLIDSLPDSKGFVQLGKGWLRHDMNGMVLKGSHLGEDFEVVKSNQSLYSIHVEYNYIDKKRDCVDVSTLEDTYFGLKLVSSTVTPAELEAYYTARGVPEPYLTYLNAAADGDNPFVYIKGDGTIAVSLVDAAKHDLQATDVPMTVPDDFPLGTYTVAGVIKDLAELGIKMPVRDKELGYELRCAAPIAYDIDYTRSLGEAAVDFLLKGGNSATITLQGNQIVPIPSETIMDPATGRTGVRMVNVDSFTYRSAYKFMIRLKPQHASDTMLLARMAMQTNLTIDQFRERYGYLAGVAPRPF